MPDTTTLRTFAHMLFPEDWQLAKAQANEGLTAIVLPLGDGEYLPEDLSNCRSAGNGRIVCDRPGWSDGWDFGLDWSPGDRVCFAEPWVYSNRRKKVQARSWFHEDADEFAQWQPPQFMPEEAARFWFEVTAIHVEQIQKIRPTFWVDSGIFSEQDLKLSILQAKEKLPQLWNDAHAKHPYKPGLWAIVLVVKAVDFVEEN